MAADGHYPYQASIDAYGNDGFRFAEMSHKGSLLCLPTGMHAWPADCSEGITAESLKPVLDAATDLDVLLIGAGLTGWEIPEDLRQVLRKNGIIADATDTGSAIRTYNILLGERRAVGAALIAVKR